MTGGERGQEMTGLVVAGGASRRMGVDKALLQRDGTSLLERAVAALAPVVDRVLVASGDGRRLPGPWTQVADAEGPGHGPMAAVVAGLRASRQPLLAVLAVDLAAPSGALLTWLADQWDGEAPAVVPHADGHLQPLVAVYAPGSVALLEARLAAGEYSLVAALEGRAQVIAQERCEAIAGPGFARNLNTPADARAVGIDVPQSSPGRI